MPPEDHFFNASYFWSDSSNYYHNSNYRQAPPREPKPYVWPEQPESYPQIQEGDHGLIILRQASVHWRNCAIQDLVRQVREREKMIGCQFEIVGSILPDGSMLVDWHRFACEGVPGGGK